MLLDTSVCIDLMRETGRGVDGPARRYLASLGDSPIFISIFTLCELHAGVELSARTEEERDRVLRLRTWTTVVEPDASFPVLYGEAAAALLSAGTPIPVMDLLIGVTAKAHDVPVVTRDPTHFRRIPGLVVRSYDIA